MHFERSAAAPMRSAAALHRLAVRLGQRPLPVRTWAPASGAARVLPAAGRWYSESSSKSGGRKQAVQVAASAAVDEELGGNGSERIIETELRLEAERSYLSYAMSVIVGRALPDVRDGLKPVHRRILFAMHELGLQHSKPFRKCARVVGEVLGKFHPHGDTAVYDALVRLAQDFSMRVQLVDGHGNFGSLDDDPPAAMRYTECRLRSVASAMLLADLEAATVDWVPNFDASVDEPSVLPARLPNLLINGSSGIAVGIATKIPPHNMGEVVAGLKALIRNPDITVRQLMQHIPAPDFPTGGEILLTDGVRAAYEEGKGGVQVRAKMHIEDGSTMAGKRGKGKKSGGRADKPLVVITELPYQTNKASLVEQIARLVDDGVLTGVSDVRDESDRDGLRVVVEVKRGGSPELVLNQLVKHTVVSSRFSANMVALVGAQPRTLNLKEFLQHFLDFRCEVVERRARHELGRAQQRLHLVDGFLTAMGHLDAVVQAIRSAPDAASASTALQSPPFELSKEQAEGVLGLTLRRLTSLEAAKLQEEQATLRAKIADLQDLLAKRDRILQVVEQEADELVAKYGTPRRTAIVADAEVELRQEDIIPNTPSLIVYSRRGYIKRMRADAFDVQRLGGKGKTGARLKGDDSLDEVAYVSDHDHLLFFTSEGRAYCLRAFDVPEGSRTSIGTAFTQVLKGLSKSTRIAAVIPVSDFGTEPGAGAADRDLVLMSRKGLIKRVPLKQFASIQRNGLAAMGVRDGDALQFVGLCSPTDSVLVAASDGQILHFAGNKLRQMGRTAAGVQTMRLSDDAEIVAMSILPLGVAPEGSIDEEDDEEGSSSAATSSGSTSPADEEEEEDGAAAAAAAAGPCLLLVSAQGQGKRTPISDFRLMGRTGKGVRGMRLNPGDRLAAVQVVGVEPSAAAAAVAAGSSSDEEDRSSSRGGKGGGQAKEPDVLLSTQQGQLVRVPLSSINVQGRNTKGRRVLKVREGDEVIAATVLSKQR